MHGTRKVVLVTGCTKGGIGFALCEEYANQGCIVYATARNPKAMQGFQHPDIKTLQLDVTDDQNVQDVVKSVVDNEGRIDVLVNNAGVCFGGVLLETPLDAVKTAYEVNVFAVLRITRAVFPHMAARGGGAIVNIGSISAEVALPWNGAYSSSKASLRGLSDVLWMELKPFNIVCTHVAAGAVRTNLLKHAMDNGLYVPEDSLYAPFKQQIERRMRASDESPTAPPADVFAARVVRATLSAHPPRFITLGGHSTTFWLLSFLPKTWALKLMWRACMRIGHD